MDLTRNLKHLMAPLWLTRRAFPAASLQAIEAAVAAAERRHSGELRFVVEGGLPLALLWRDLSPRARAQELFAQLRVWDTEHNSGVLIYVQLIDHRVEIVADRGIAARVPQTQWEDVCRGMEQAFARGAYGAGAVAAVERVGAILAGHFPAAADQVNELADRPLVL